MTSELAGKKVQNINSLGMFDLSKGILMLLVILAHSTNLFLKNWELTDETAILMVPLAVGKFLAYGIIPLFFMISGYGFRKQKTGKCIRNRIHYLLKPYLWVAIVVTILAVLKKLLKHESVLEALRYQAFPFLLGLCPGETEVFGWYTSSIGPLWFLVVLGLSWIGLNLIFYLDNDVIRVVCIVTLAAFGTRLPFYAFIPFCLVQALCCIAYLYIGYCIKRNKVLTQKLTKKTWAMLILILVCIVPFGNIEVSQNVWKLGFLDFVASCIAGFLFLKLLILCNQFEGKFAKFLRGIGRYSLYILCVHTVEYLVFPWEQVAQMFAGHILLGIVTVTVVRTLFVLLGCYFIKIIVKVKRHRK